MKVLDINIGYEQDAEPWNVIRRGVSRVKIRILGYLIRPSGPDITVPHRYAKSLRPLRITPVDRITPRTSAAVTMFSATRGTADQAAPYCPKEPLLLRNAVTTILLTVTSLCCGP